MGFWAAFVGLVVAMFVAMNAFAQEKKDTEKPAAACCQKSDAAKSQSCEGQTAAAQEKAGCCSKDGRSEMIAKTVAAEKSGCSAQAGEKGGCSGATGCHARGVPAMMYQVGDEEMDCPMQAEKMAAETKKPVRFVVNKKVYENKGEALAAYADLLEKHLQTVTAVQYVVGNESMACPVSAKELAEKQKAKVRYRVAATTFDDQAVAEKAAKLAKESSEKVALVMKVGDKQYQCPMEAKEACKDGKQIVYQVGDVQTPCQVTARTELAKARIQAALKAISEVAGV